MAKQRQDRSNPARSQTRKPTPRHSASAPARQAGAEAQDEAAARRRATYLAAVALYEQGVQALQQHEYTRAAELLNRVLEQYPDELDLHERVRLYLRICERQVAPAPSAPRTAEERIYAATLALNAGTPERALPQLQAVLDHDPENDHALYMLAVVHTMRDEPALALECLLQAVALNPENRGLARQDPDLERLRQDPQVRAMLDAPPGFDHRRLPSRHRPAR